MPFKVVQVSGGYKVQDDTGKFYSNKPISKMAAERQARALYENVPEASKAILTPQTGKPARQMAPNVGGGVNRAQLPASDFVDPKGRRFPIVTAADVSDAVSSYGRADPKIPFEEFKRRVIAICRRKGFMSSLPAEWRKDLEEAKEAASITIYKGKDGELRWVLFSSNAYRDQDNEIVSVKAIEHDVDQSMDEFKQGEKPDFGPLRWWHVEGADLGRCDYRTVSDSGRTLIESGTFSSKQVGEKIKEAAGKLQVSIGFNHPPDEPDKSGVYRTIKVFERSILPQGKAANPFTKVLVEQGAEPMVTKEEKLKALRALLGDEADEILQQADASEKELDEKGIAYKEADLEPEEQPEAAEEKAAKPAGADKAPEPEPATEEETEEEYLESDEEDVVGNMPVSQYKSLLKEAFGEAMGPLNETMKKMAGSKKEADPDPVITDLEKTVKEMTEKIQRLSRQLKELQGETPKAAKGFRASESDETVIDEEKQKELGAPTNDPYAVKFVNDLLGIGSKG